MIEPEMTKKPWRRPVVLSQTVRPGVSFACTSASVDSCPRGSYFCSEDVNGCIACNAPCEPV